MNKAKKKKQVAAEPLQEPPETMLPCEPAVPRVETFEERVIRATCSMSPEKTRVAAFAWRWANPTSVATIFAD